MKYTPGTRIRIERIVRTPLSRFVSFFSFMDYLFSLSPSLLPLPFLLLLFFLLLLRYFYYNFTFTCSPSISRRKNVFQIGAWSSAIRSVRGSVKNLHFRKEFHRLSYKVDRLSSIEISRLDTWPNFDRKLKIYLWTNGGTLQWYMY